MTIRTNLSWNTLARYNAMMWNNNEEPYCIGEDAFREVFLNSGESLLTLDYLKKEALWNIDKQEIMLEEDFIGVCHQDYKEGYRDSATIEGHKKYLEAKKGINAFKRELKKWMASAEEVPDWTLMLNIPEDLLIMPKEFNGKVLPNLH